MDRHNAPQKGNVTHHYRHVSKNSFHTLLQLIFYFLSQHLPRVTKLS